MKTHSKMLQNKINHHNVMIYHHKIKLTTLDSYIVPYIKNIKIYTQQDWEG